jgi:hypothetical protein
MDYDPVVAEPEPLPDQNRPESDADWLSASRR